MQNNIVSIAITQEDIKSKIHSIRNMQVMIDSDLAELYQVETKQLNKAVNRNIARFPERFRFQLTKEEYEEVLRFQIGTLKDKPVENGRGQHRKYLPYVFTEQGVSMLSAVLRSDIAIEISIQIIDTFVEMKKYISTNEMLFQRFERIENKLTIHDENFNQLFKAMEDKNSVPEQMIFYNGEFFDAYSFVSNLIRSATRSIVLVDNYIDDATLTLFTKNQLVNVTIYTHSISRQLKSDLDKYNSQYKPIIIKNFKDSHDRFLIVDDVDVYSIGASLKDLAKKMFAFNKMSSFTLTDIINEKVI